MTYFLYGGTLVGSLIHDDVLPWDDDIDLAMAINDYYKMFTKLRELVNKLAYY